MTQLNTNGLHLIRDLEMSRSQMESRRQAQSSAQKVHVVGAGATLTAAYEQLRNAAEYAEEHVLLQRAIRRFYRRLFVLRDQKQISSSGEELIIELTHAGYIANDTVSDSEVQEISLAAVRYYAAYDQLQQRRDISQKQAEQWTYELLAVEIDWRLNDNGHLQAFTQFAHAYFLETIDTQALFGEAVKGVDISLYIAVHRALLKSDDAVVRLGLLRRFQQSPDNLASYIDVNQQIEQVLNSSVTEKLFRTIDRRGAHLGAGRCRDCAVRHRGGQWYSHPVESGLPRNSFGLSNK